jgi:glucan biosynthesis protein
MVGREGKEVFWGTRWGFEMGIRDGDEMEMGEGKGESRARPLAGGKQDGASKYTRNNTY